MNQEEEHEEESPAEEDEQDQQSYEDAEMDEEEFNGDGISVGGPAEEKYSEIIKNLH